MSLLQNLCRANQGILRQKLNLMEILQKRHGPLEALQLYQKFCPIVKATIGQHMRHSVDHVERAVIHAAATIKNAGDDDEIHYDTRKRNTPDERDWYLMEARIRSIEEQLQDLSSSEDVGASEAIVLQPVNACFMLSGDNDQEFCIPSTVGRELAFAAHHAIHHLALIKIIATCRHVGQLNDDDLPSDFGRAPSTVNFDRAVTAEKQ